MTAAEIIHAMRPSSFAGEHVIRLRGVSRQAVTSLPFAWDIVTNRDTGGSMTVEVPDHLQGRFADDLAKAWPDMLALDASAEIVKP